MKKHVCVIYGGISVEREISIITAHACIKALKKSGYKVSSLDVRKNFAKQLCLVNPDVIFNALHGFWGEDGQVQTILESLKIPYTHSGIKASKMAMDKPKAKSIFKKANILCPKGRVIDKKNLFKTDLEKYPVVVKPINSGSSVGVTIVSNKQMKKQAIKNLSKMDKKVLIEEFIPGHEIQVAVLGKRALGAIEIVPKEVFYDYKAKYFDKGSTKHLMPAPLSKNEYNKILRLALLAHKKLGCQGVTRSDFRYDDTSPNPKFYLLEVNTQPGMTPRSLVPEIAAYSGISFNKLVEWIVEDASKNR